MCCKYAPSVESTQALATATHTGPTIRHRTRNSVLGTLADGTSPTSLTFSGPFLGGLHDRSLERAVAEAEALDQEVVQPEICVTTQDTDEVPKSAQSPSTVQETNSSTTVFGCRPWRTKLLINVLMRHVAWFA